MAIAEALAIVNVGNSEWLFSKWTPSVLTFQRAGVSRSLTEPCRRPSATKRITLRGRGCVFAAGPAVSDSAAASAIPGRVFITVIR